MSRILVIEDEASLRKDVVRWLQFEGYEAIGAADGMEGLEMARQFMPDLVVSDIMMPRLDGHGVLLNLRASTDTSNIPFIFLTAMADHDDMRKGMELGADDYLTKPFTRVELLRAIASRLEKQSRLETERETRINDLNQVLEQEREQRMLKARLSAMIAHDFGNQIAVIMASNSLLRDYADRLTPERRLDHLNQIESSSRQLLQMMDDLLFIGQLESGKLSCNPQMIDLRQFTENIIREFKKIYGDKCQITFTSTLEQMVSVDKKLVRQIVANLISNAIKYSRNLAEVDIELVQINNEIVVKVADHGIGIPAENQPELFEAFRRASNVGNIKGTGLGLAIVKQAVDLHGGEITFQSQTDVGTTFYVSLPLRVVEPVQFRLG